MEEKGLDYFYPTSALVTGPDIIFFWVARMIMAGLEFKGFEKEQGYFPHGRRNCQDACPLMKSISPESYAMPMDEKCQSPSVIRLTHLN